LSWRWLGRLWFKLIFLSYFSLIFLLRFFNIFFSLILRRFFCGYLLFIILTDIYFFLRQFIYVNSFKRIFSSVNLLKRSFEFIDHLFRFFILFEFFERYFSQINLLFWLFFQTFILKYLLSYFPLTDIFWRWNHWLLALLFCNYDFLFIIIFLFWFFRHNKWLEKR